ncbi:MAG: hypothetical protein WCG80_00910 [Spirochaetales bacterium]
MFLLVVVPVLPAQQTDFFTSILKGLGLVKENQVTITDATSLIEAKDYDGALKVALSLIEQQNYNDAMAIAKQLVPLKQLAPAVNITSKLIALNPHPEQQIVFDGYGDFLAIADLLIKEQDYNDALVVLAGVIRRPDYLDDAQVLINKVRDLRNRYNSLGDELVAALKVGDAEKAKGIIVTMESVDKNPNDKTLVQIKLAKRSVNKIVFEKQVNAIMDAAALLLKNREYGAAILKYLEAEPVAKAEFAENQYGNITENLVNRSWDDLKAATALLTPQEAALKTSATTGTRLLGGPLADLTAGLAGLTDTWKSFFSWRKRVWASNQQFQTQASLILKSRTQDDFYLTYSLWLDQGRPTAKAPEGILYAMDQLWTEAITPWSQQIRTRVETQYQQAKTTFEAGQYDASLTAFQSLKVLTRSSVDLLALNNLQAYVLDDGSLDRAYTARLKDTLPLAVQVQSRLLLANQGAQASLDLKALAVASSDRNLDRPGLEAARANVRTMRENFIADAEKTTSGIRRETSLAQDGWKLLDPLAVLNGWLAQWNTFRQKAAGQEAVFVDRRGKLDYDLLDGRNAQLVASLAAAQTQVQGVVSVVAGNTQTKRLPLQASVALEALRPLQDVLQKDIAAFIGLYDGETPEVKTAAVLAWPPKGRTLLAALAQSQALQTQLLATARANYAQSQTLKKQGQDLGPQVEAAIGAENFPQAKTLLTQMSGLYTQSLAAQDDPVFAASAEKENARLNDLYNKGFQNLVVKDVRKYITDGSQAYLNAQFAAAEQVLTKAKSRWAEAYGDANEEVARWLNLATIAQGASTGREVNAIDPLYNEVQQLLNFARRDYNDAQALLKAGKTKDSDALFDRAIGVLSKILLIYPFNQEMGLLKLQIEKDRNPDGFSALFKTKLDTAVAQIAKNPAQAYTDLQDLDKIQPGDASLAAAIKRVRTVLGLEKQPLDPAKKIQADKLYAQAKAAYDSGNINRFAQARVDVDSALSLIQPTSDARYTALKDLLSQSTNTSVTFSLAQQAEWESILGAVNQGSFVIASGLLDGFKRKYPNTVRDSRVVQYTDKISNGLNR